MPEIIFPERTEPTTPQTNETTLYVDGADSHLKIKDSTGLVTDITATASVTPAQLTARFAATVGEVGVIKANYSGNDLGFTGILEDVDYFFDNDNASPSLSSSSDFPNSAPSSDLSSLFDNTRSTDNPGILVGKWIENPVSKQSHLWRISCDFSGKGNNDNIGIEIFLKNPTSGFRVGATTALASGTTSGSFTVNLITIADSASIPSPNGYLLGMRSTKEDTNFGIYISSITRITGATKE